MDNWLSEKKVPCDRPGDDEDMAQAILMLARNRYVNGQTVVVDGGLLFGMVSLASSFAEESMRDVLVGYTVDDADL